MSPFETLLAAFMLGLMSIPHCVAMCGPLAVLSCTARQRGGYLASRMISYAVVGSVMGWLGAHTLARVEAAGRWSLVAVASVCIWRAVRVYRRPNESATGTPLITLRRAKPGLLSTLLGALPKRGAGLGIVTSILPCGALAAAWTNAAASAHPISGAASMAVFAVASTPALVLAIGGREMMSRISQRTPRPLLAGAWLAGAAILLGRAWLIAASCHG